MANESAKMTMWRGAIQKGVLVCKLASCSRIRAHMHQSPLIVASTEQAAARTHAKDWDFLCVHDEPAARAEQKRVPIKYGTHHDVLHGTCPPVHPSPLKRISQGFHNL
jgi:hypothetical protein